MLRPGTGPDVRVGRVTSLAVVRLPLPLILLIGKYLFLALLYAFIYVLFREMLAELRPARGAQHVAVRQRATPEPRSEPSVASAAAPASAPALVVVRTFDPQSLPVGTIVKLEPILTVGRSDENSLCLRDRFVSSRHAVIQQASSRYRIRDEGSTNGTFVNGQRIAGDVTLNNGDRVEIGATMFEFREHSSNDLPL